MCALTTGVMSYRSTTSASAPDDDGRLFAMYPRQGRHRKVQI